MGKVFLESVECQTDIPDHSANKSEIDSELSVGGETIAHVIGEWLQQDGALLSAPQLHEGHCWETEARFGNRTFLISTFQFGHEVTIQTQEVSFFVRKFLGGRSIHLGLVQLLHRKLLEDDRFRSLKWYPFGFDARHWGSPSPLAAEYGGSSK